MRSVVLYQRYPYWVSLQEAIGLFDFKQSVSVLKRTLEGYSIESCKRSEN